MRCPNCDNKFDADKTDTCQICDTPVVSVTCPECSGVYDPTIYGEDNCPYC